jgi:hypothetical protein
MPWHCSSMFPSPTALTAARPVWICRADKSIPTKVASRLGHRDQVPAAAAAEFQHPLGQQAFARLFRQPRQFGLALGRGVQLPGDVDGLAEVTVEVVLMIHALASRMALASSTNPAPERCRAT